MNYKIAILLLSSKDFYQFDYFMYQFGNDDRFNIYIHRDIKVKFTEEEEKYIRKKYTNIKEIISEVDITPLEYSMVDAEEKLLRLAYSDENIYYVLISEETILVKGLTEIYETLSDKNDTMAYIEIKHRDSLSSDFIERQFKKSETDYYYNWFGSQWFIFRKELVKTICDKMNDRNYVQNLIDRQGYHCADESFFQNMLKSDSDFDDLNIKKTLTFVVWNTKLSSYSSHKPIYLDFQYLKYYKIFGIMDCLFARKINIKYDGSVEFIRKLNEYINENN